MDLTIFLAQVFGLYLIIGGLVVMLRQSYFVPVVGGFVREKMLRMVVGTLELLGGLFLTLSHFDFSSVVAGIISLFGVLMLVEGVLYLSLADSKVERIIAKINTKAWYTWGGGVSILLGLYLAAVGFALF